MTSDLRKQNENWEKLATIDPYWSILVEDGTINNKWSVDKFYDTGKVQISKILSFLSNIGIKFQTENALDYGCGVGRLTEALSGYFKEVYGVDFSNRMIDLAIQHNPYSNVKYLRTNGYDLKMFPDRKFDFIISLITLQHSPPKIQYDLIEEMMRVCSPKGIIIFSAVTHFSFAHTVRNIAAKISPDLANYLLALRQNLRNKNLGHYKEGISSQIFRISSRKVTRIAEKNKFNLRYYVSSSLNWKGDDPLEIFILQPYSKAAL